MSTAREVTQVSVYQGISESIAYTVTFTNWGTPSSPTAVLYNEARVDVSLTHLTGSASVDGDIVTTPFVGSLENGATYYLHVRATVGGNTMECYVKILGEY